MPHGMYIGTGRGPIDNLCVCLNMCSLGLPPEAEEGPRCEPHRERPLPHSQKSSWWRFDPEASRKWPFSHVPRQVEPPGTLGSTHLGAQLDGDLHSASYANLKQFRGIVVYT